MARNRLAGDALVICESDPKKYSHPWFVGVCIVPLVVPQEGTAVSRSSWGRAVCAPSLHMCLARWLTGVKDARHEKSRTTPPPRHTWRKQVIFRTIGLKIES